MTIIEQIDAIINLQSLYITQIKVMGEHTKREELLINIAETAIQTIEVLKQRLIETASGVRTIQEMLK